MLWFSNESSITCSIWRCRLFVVAILVEIASAGASCNGYFTELKAETYKQVVTSPNYPNEYETNSLCRWTVSTYRPYEVIRFQIIDMAITVSANCAEDYLEIKDGLQSWSPVIRRYCGINLNNLIPVTSSSREVAIIFKTYSSYADRGFKLAYWSVPKDEVIYTQPVWNASNYITLGIFFAIVLFIAISMVTIAILRQIHFTKTRMNKSHSEPPVKQAHKIQQDLSRDLSCDSVTAECNTTRTSLGESATNLASLL